MGISEVVLLAMMGHMAVSDNIKVISSEECVPKHKLLVMDMWFKATKTWHRKFEPRVHVWKLKEEKTCEEYMVAE